MVNGVPREVPRQKPEGPPALRIFWPRDFPSDSIHHDSPKAFPHIFILLSSRTSKEEFIAANGLLRELKVQTLVELNPNILVQDAIIMCSVYYSVVFTSVVLTILPISRFH